MCSYSGAAADLLASMPDADRRKLFNPIGKTRRARHRLRVAPAVSFCDRRLVAAATLVVVTTGGETVDDVDQREEHGDDDEADRDAQEDDQHGFDSRGK